MGVVNASIVGMGVISAGVTTMGIWEWSPGGRSQDHHGAVHQSEHHSSHNNLRNNLEQKGSKIYFSIS